MFFCFFFFFVFFGFDLKKFKKKLFHDFSASFEIVVIFFFLFFFFLFFLFFGNIQHIHEFKGTLFCKIWIRFGIARIGKKRNTFRNRIFLFQKGHQ